MKIAHLFENSNTDHHDHAWDWDAPSYDMKHLIDSKKHILEKLEFFRKENPGFTEAHEQAGLFVTAMGYGKYLQAEFKQFKGKCITFASLFDALDKSSIEHAYFQMRVIDNIFDHFPFKADSVLDECTSVPLYFSGIHKSDNNDAMIDHMFFGYPQNLPLNIPFVTYSGYESKSALSNFVKKLKEVSNKVVIGSLSLFSYSVDSPKKDFGKRLEDFVTSLAANRISIRGVEIGSRFGEYIENFPTLSLFRQLAIAGVTTLTEENPTFKVYPNLPREDTKKVFKAMQEYLEHIVPEHGSDVYVLEDFIEESEISSIIERLK